MPSETLQAIVLRHANYRDNDRMLALLSPLHGRVDALARGCRKPKSPIMASSEVFVHGEFVLFQQGGRYTVTSCEITDSFYPLRLDDYRMTCGMYLLELAQAAAQPEQPANELYALMLTALYHLAYIKDEPPLSVVSATLLLFANLAGYRPRLNHCASCRQALDTTDGAALVSAAGGLCCRACAPNNADWLSAGEIAWMRSTLATGFTQQQQKTDASRLFVPLRRYVESRLDQTIKSSRFLP